MYIRQEYHRNNLVILEKVTRTGLSVNKSEQEEYKQELWPEQGKKQGNNNLDKTVEQVPNKEQEQEHVNNKKRIKTSKQPQNPGYSKEQVQGY